MFGSDFLFRNSNFKHYLVHVCMLHVVQIIGIQCTYCTQNLLGFLGLLLLLYKGQTQNVNQWGLSNVLRYSQGCATQLKLAIALNLRNQKTKFMINNTFEMNILLISWSIPSSGQNEMKYFKFVDVAEKNIFLQ